MNNRLLTLGIFVLLIGIPFVLAQSGEAQGGVVAEQTETQVLGPAEQEIIDEAINYVKEKLGKDYYNNYLEFQSGESFMDCSVSGCITRNEILFSYDVPFETAGDPSFGPGPNIQITMDEDGDVTRYAGPMRPYEFLISKEEAINLAKEYGLVNITEAGVATSLVKENGYEIVWVVSSRDVVGYGEVIGEPIYAGVYIDVDSGQVRGKYRINPMVQTPGAAGGVMLDEFSEEQNVINEDTGSKSWGFIIAIAIVALVIVSFVLYRIFRK